MIKFNKFSSGIANNLQLIPYHDNSLTSEKYFRVIDLPSHFYLGKNGFKINANNENLVFDSKIYIDIIDTNGNSVYYEIIEVDSDDTAKTVVVYIYDDTPAGEATVYIAGRANKNINGTILNYNNNKSSADYLNNPNIVWFKKTIIISTEVNNKAVLFLKEPYANAIEKKVKYKKFNNSETRETLINGSMTNLISYYPPSNNLNQTPNKSNSNSLNNKDISLDKLSISNTVNKGNLNYPIIQSNGFKFTPDMVNGIITIDNLDTTFNVITAIDEFKFKIISIIDSNRVYITPEFSHNLISSNKLNKLSNFNIKYLTAKEDDIIQEFNESFIQFEFKDIEPIIGYVDNVRITYKAFGSFGNFIDLGHYNIQPFNYLYDETAVQITPFNIIEYPIGFSTGNINDFHKYWKLIDRKNNIIYNESEFLDVGIKFINSNIVNDENSEYDFSFKLNDIYQDQLLQLEPNSEYTIILTVKFGQPINNEEVQQIDIFSKNLKVDLDVNDNKLTSSYELNKNGFYIGSITNKGTSLLIEEKIFFKTNEFIKFPLAPEFFIKNCKDIEFKDIRIETRMEPGFSPQQAKLYLPVNTIKNDTDLLIDIEYFNGANIKGNYTSHLSGIRFDGVDTLDLIISSSITSGSIDTYVTNQEEVTRTQLINLINNSELKPGLIYKISGVHKTLYNDGTNSGSVIYLKALDTNHLETDGYGEFYNPIYGLFEDHYNIWFPYEEIKFTSLSTIPFKYENLIKSTSTTGEIIEANSGLTGKILMQTLLIKIDDDILNSDEWEDINNITGNDTSATCNVNLTNIKPLNKYEVDKHVIWGGYVWKNLNGRIGNTSDGLYHLNSEWEKIPYTNLDYYYKVYDKIRYDVGIDKILLREDILNNKIEYDNTYLNYITSIGLSLINPISAFQFGNNNVKNNLVLNSIYANINNTAEENNNNNIQTSILNNLILLDGKINENNIDSSKIDKLILYKTNFLLNDFLDSTLTNVKLSNSIFESNKFDNNSNLTDILFIKGTLKNNNILNNSQIEYCNYTIPVEISHNTISNQSKISGSLSYSTIATDNVTGIKISHNDIINKSSISPELIVTGSGERKIEITYNNISLNSEIIIKLISDNNPSLTKITNNNFYNTKIDHDQLNNNTGIDKCTFNSSNIIGPFFNSVPLNNLFKNVTINIADIENVNIGMSSLLYTELNKIIFQLPDLTKKIQFINNYGVMAIANLID